jgi:hypothetical protein
MRSATSTNRVPSQQQFCSRLVAQAYAAAGIDLVFTPDFCTPDDVKNSPLLAAVPDVVKPVSDEHVETVERDFDTNEVMREVTNNLLNLARTRNRGIENLRDIDDYLVSNPSEDKSLAKFYDDSGYLSAWKAEFDKNRWQYELPLLIAMPGALEDKRAYCVGTIEDHGDMVVREEWFAVLTRQNPQQAQFTRIFIEGEGSREVCTFCGDSPAPNYRATGVTVQRDTVLTAKLCDGCRRIRKEQFNEEYSPL